MAADRRPIPDLVGRQLTGDEWELIPEKLESNWGGLGWDEAECLDLLALALVSVGLRRAIALAPRALWEQALTDVALVAEVRRLRAALRAIAAAEIGETFPTVARGESSADDCGDCLEKRALARAALTSGAPVGETPRTEDSDA